MAEEQEHLDTTRIRTLSIKADDNYLEACGRYIKKIDSICCKLKNTVAELSTIEASDKTQVQEWRVKLCAIRKEYEIRSYEYLGFLQRTHTEDSLCKYNEHKTNMTSMNETVKDAMDSIRDIPNTTPVPEEIDNSVKARKSSISSHSVTTSGKSKTSIATQKRAKAEAARASLEIARKEVLLRKQIAALEEEGRLAEAKTDRIKAEYNADLTLHAEEKEVAAADAEASYLESESGSVRSRGSFISHHSIPTRISNTEEMTRQYVASLPDWNVQNKDNLHVLQTEGEIYTNIQNTTHTVPMDTQMHQSVALAPKSPPFIPHGASNDCTVKPDTEALTSFLLKKELLLQRLYTFDDEPPSFDVWKASFNSVTQELKVNSFVQLDLLVKYLGKESSSYAQSLRTSNARNPERAVRLIWERLEERYGCPEMIEFALKSKLEKFPVLSNKDNKKLYELSDVLDEVLSAKEDPRFAVQFAVFDSSRGVNSIVVKLPYNIQQKWVTHASRYNKQRNIPYPSFSVFVEFIHDVCKIRNDPAFNLEAVHVPTGNQKKEKSAPQRKNDKVFVVNRKTGVQEEQTDTDKDKRMRCVIHNAGHPLMECKEFRSKTWEQRRALLRSKGVCYRCLASTEHMSPKCPIDVTCDKCGRKNHLTIMHREEPMKYHGVESKGEPEIHVAAKRTAIHGKEFRGQSCGKTVLVDVMSSSRPAEKFRVYALIDDQSNRSLVTPELCEMMGISGEAMTYTLSSCSGRTTMVGQRIDGLSVQSVGTTERFDLPELIECNYIPQDLSEVATPEIASNYPHLVEVAPMLHSLNANCGIHLLIGRDVPEAHHVKRQIIGPKHLPFALELPLGWVIIGKVCLGRFHQPDVVHAYKTNVDIDGRGTVMDLCKNMRTILEYKDSSSLSYDIFHKTPEDNKVGLSADDRQFVKIMDSELTKDSSGQWMAPLPFKEPREVLPNNRAQAYHRAKILDKSLQQNYVKRQHMVEFMDKVFRNGAAEVATDTDKEKWYLPLFGVYHPRKPGQIRGVFDSSVVYEGKSLNDMLLSGPNLTNSIVGVLLRFRGDAFAVSADIEQMFYRFLVTPDHRRFLRFFWYRENNPNFPLMEYQMRVHVFGNRPSPAVATYGLRHTVQKADKDVRQHVHRDFYVDDAFSSHPTRELAVSLLSRTQEILKEEGAIRLHKIASNDVRIMNEFPKEDLSKDLKNLDLDSDSLPQQMSLGLTWDLQFSAPDVRKPFSKRGLLSAMNSVYDPLGFLAPFAVSGKMLLREVCSDGSSWDDELPIKFLEQWNAWNDALHQLDGYQVPRMFIKSSLSLLQNPRVYIYSDASEKGVAAVAYLVSTDTPNDKDIGFIMGKAKVAPKNGHSIPRLELCGAVLGVELAQCIAEHLDIPSSAFRYFTDSKVVLGYIHNRTRRFYTYVSNRVAHIHDFSEPDQWNYVHTDSNPADTATRSSLHDVKSAIVKWHSGPAHKLLEDKGDKEVFSLDNPETDEEVRPEVSVKFTSVESPTRPDSALFETFSSWKRLVATYAILIHVARTFKKETKCGHTSWHICEVSTSPELIKAAEALLIGAVQKKFYSEEIRALGCGRQVFHQGRHFTEGSLRSNGFWLIGAKKLVSSVIGQCVVCRKLRGKLMHQKMADLPEERLTPGPPFTTVGVDVFGPWEVVTRRTRGGAANSKRWAVMFTCMTTRATHIEVIEDMSSSCFINALSRLIAIRGPVKTLWSDRGTNFVGAASLIKAHVIHIESPSVQTCLKNVGIVWRFNSPHSSHMGGVWERPIGVARRILESMLANRAFKELTHDVLCTFMYEVAAVMNSKPLVAVDSDAQDPLVLSPSILLTQKQGDSSSALAKDLSLKEMYTAQWKQVQILSDMFWKRWRSQFLQTLQTRRKWQIEQRNLQVNDLVLLKDVNVARCNWPVGIISRLFPSSDGKVRKCEVRVGHCDGVPSVYTRPVTDLVMLLSEDK